MIPALKPISKLIPIVFLGVMLLSLVAAPVKAQSQQIKVLTGVRLVNVEKVDLAANTKLDFYLWFSWDPTQIILKQIQEFEFLNGSPSKEVVYVTEAEGFIQYRVKGDFLKTFDFTHYPFETQDLQVKIEHKNMNSTETCSTWLTQTPASTLG